MARAVVHARVVARMLPWLTDQGRWVSEGVLGCSYPRTERALAALPVRGVRLLVNLHERPHDRGRLERHGLREAHLPVKDFTAPSFEQIERAMSALEGARTAGEAAAVHCSGGLGRTGTILACYLVRTEGLGAEEAIERVRAVTPGSVETRAQVAAVEAYARLRRGRSAKKEPKRRTRKRPDP
ncbi:MAG: dual specificity protein phosphatase family protein [Rubrobacter sp.]|nr:dual specificity protein phosphatase family protein [Rubrobacter sp.]